MRVPRPAAITSTVNRSDMRWAGYRRAEGRVGAVRPCGGSRRWFQKTPWYRPRSHSGGRLGRFRTPGFGPGNGGSNPPPESSRFESLSRSVRSVHEHVFGCRGTPLRRSRGRAAIASSKSWAEVLRTLGYGYFGKNIKTVRRWAAKWGYLSNTCPMAVEWNDAAPQDGHGHRRGNYGLTILGGDAPLPRILPDTGGNWKTVKRRVAELGISTEHFDPYAAPAGRCDPADALEGHSGAGVELQRGNRLKRRPVRGRPQAARVSCVDRASYGTDGGWRSSSITSREPGTITDSKTSESSARTVPLRSTPIAARKGRQTRDPALSFGTVRGRSSRGTGASAIARANAGLAGIVEVSSDPALGRRNVRATSGYSPRSRRSVTWLWGGSTACPTTRSASGCASMSRSGWCRRAGQTRKPRSRAAHGRTGAEQREAEEQAEALKRRLSGPSRPSAPARPRCPAPSPARQAGRCPARASP